MMTTASTARNTIADMPLPPAPFRSTVMQIEPQWIDYNGHLNMRCTSKRQSQAIVIWSPRREGWRFKTLGLQNISTRASANAVVFRWLCGSANGPIRTTTSFGTL